MRLASEACVWGERSLAQMTVFMYLPGYSPFQGLLLHLSNNSKTTLSGASIQLFFKKQYLSQRDKLENSP